MWLFILMWCAIIASVPVHHNTMEAFAMPNMEAQTVAQFVAQEVVARFGVPYAIHSDQGKQFEGKVFTEMCKLLNIKKTRTTPYHPQSDGMVERFNKTLLAMLRTLVDDNQLNWDELLPYVLMAYRSVQHETTGCTPNYLMLGREVATPLDIVYEMPVAIKAIPQNQWAWELKEKLELAHSLVRKHSSQAMKRQKTLHDLKLNWQKFQAGDQVYVYFPRYMSGQSPKLSQFWRGPFNVEEKVSDVTYKVNCGAKGKPQIIHVDRMRLKVRQRLSGEDVAEETSLDTNESKGEDCNESVEHAPDMSNDGMNLIPETRVRRPPKWLKDYDTT